MSPKKILIKNIKTLVQIENNNDRKKWVAGSEMATLPVLDDAYVYIKGECIADFGSMNSMPIFEYDELIDATDRIVMPTWCDSHTHIVYAGSREQEFVYRIKGMSYEEIAARGGGILNSAKRLQVTSEEELLKNAFSRLCEVQKMGTGAIEIKSGYGLTVKDELKMLRVIKKLKTMTNMPIKANFLGAHALPIEFKADRAKYINLITQEMIPQIAEEKLADYCDVFCDRGFFTVEETDTILQAAADYGLAPKIHANELDFSGGIQVGVKNKARSVDHLEYVGKEEIDTLLASDTMPTLLPSTAFFLNLPHYAPARKMIDSGLPVALASDYNPGSSPSGNMQLVLTMACAQMKMTPQEAIHAATLNGAYAMNLEKEVGTIAVGKLANLILTKKIPSIEYIPYSFGSTFIENVVIKGIIQ